MSASAWMDRVREGFAGIRAPQDLRERALANLERWRTDPQFQDAAPQLEYLVGTGRFEPLFDAFFRQIPFGTGGRRGPVGFGPNRINPFTVATSAQGHAEFLKQRPPGHAEPAVVIAYDVRVFRNLRAVYHPDLPNPLFGMTSLDLARIAARVYVANGLQVWFPPAEGDRYLSTPELSFTIRHLRAQGGMNLSASHNHPDDNGAKIYTADGSQEVPPLDEEIARIIEATETARSTGWEEAVRDGGIRWIPEAAHAAYLEANLRASLDRGARSARIVFTPLHGTGGDSVGAVLGRAGFECHPVPEQSAPDGTFPGAPFRSPNPEVPESLGAATDLARRIGADLVLGADPDADRLGMVVPDPERGWTFLTGNEIGALLAAYVVDRAGAAPRRRRPFALTTVVTTTLFRRILEANGIRTVSDLPVGFKYIAEAMNRIESEGRFRDLEAGIGDFVLGFEESYGFLVIPEVRDKDAAGAALLLAELASRLKSEGLSVLGYLDSIHRRYGYVRNLLRSTVMRGAQGFLDMRRIQQSLRASPPAEIGGLRVARCTDRQDESGPLGPIRSETDRDARDMLIFELEPDARVTLRPSGTEPKNKIYVEACGAPLGAETGEAEWERHKREVDGRAERVARGFAREMLARIGVRIPDWALEVSDLVALESKRDFAESLLPEILRRLERGESGPELEAWIDERLKPYGPDGRLLVRKGVAAYCAEAGPPEKTRDRLSELFALSGNREGDRGRVNPPGRPGKAPRGR